MSEHKAFCRVAGNAKFRIRTLDNTVILEGPPTTKSSVGSKLSSPDHRQYISDLGLPGTDNMGFNKKHSSPENMICTKQSHRNSWTAQKEQGW